ncbi:MAG: hypothetical protein Q8908_10665, partial [Bacteroidota bacterium]|nr:hypothetical protein [Bacteroidota bacterium]
MQIYKFDLIFDWESLAGLNDCFIGLLRMEKTVIAILCACLVIIGLPFNLAAQNYLLNGMVVDQVKNTYLPFAKIDVNDHKLQTITDFNGLFTIRSDEPIRHLLVTNAGYQPLLLDVTGSVSPLVIRLTPLTLKSDSLFGGRSDIYHFIDSLRQVDQVERMKQQQESMLSGQIGLGWFTMNLNKVKRYNQFEGVYLGLGGYTNEKLLRFGSLGGFVGYGFKDRKTKYGFDVSAWPLQNHHLTLTAGYSYDTRESGETKFFDEDMGTIEPSSFRFFYIGKMDYERKTSFSVVYKRDFADFYLALQRRVINPGYDISNGAKVLLPLEYNVSGITLGFRLDPGKIGVATGSQNMENINLPVFWFQLSRGVPGLFKGEYNYSRYQGKIMYSQDFSRLGRSSLQVVWNQLAGTAPYFEYFNGGGTFGNFGLFAPGSFVTMHPNEFISDKSIGLFFSHHFGNLFPHTLLFNPSPELVFNYGWSKLQTDPLLYFLPVMDMHNGFAEAGVQLNNLLDLNVYGVGLG